MPLVDILPDVPMNIGNNGWDQDVNKFVGYDGFWFSGESGSFSFKGNLLTLPRVFPSVKIKKFLMFSALPVCINSLGEVYVMVDNDYRCVYLSKVKFINLGNPRLCLDLSEIERKLNVVCNIDVRDPQFAVGTFVFKGYDSYSSDRSLIDPGIDSVIDSVSDIMTVAPVDSQGRLKLREPFLDEINRGVQWIQNPLILLCTSGLWVRLDKLCSYTTGRIEMYRGYYYPNKSIKRLLYTSLLPIGINNQGLIYLIDGYTFYYLTTINTLFTKFGLKQFNFSFVKNLFKFDGGKRQPVVTVQPPPSVQPAPQQVLQLTGKTDYSKDDPDNSVYSKKLVEQLKYPVTYGSRFIPGLNVNGETFLFLNEDFSSDLSVNSLYTREGVKKVFENGVLKTHSLSNGILNPYVSIDGKTFKWKNELVGVTSTQVCSRCESVESYKKEIEKRESENRRIKWILLNNLTTITTGMNEDYVNWYKAQIEKIV